MRKCGKAVLGAKTKEKSQKIGSVLLDDRGFSVVVGDEVVWTNAEFCPVCGKPLTDNVADTLIKRLRR